MVINFLLMDLLKLNFLTFNLIFKELKSFAIFKKNVCNQVDGYIHCGLIAVKQQFIFLG